ncbi:MAG: Cytochrome bd-II ubiquinol oxidase subunit 1 [Syntrophorhabdaceae bacterium PtaU1.Bin034]|nr:MAG: Cytochrome bd-II ubiquinol oxidase subunit 1 [Syntrophorhabdaceae bacterium PtaU1.Bin034]
MDFLSDVVFLSRLQFAVTIMFHIIFPTATIGLGLYLVILEALWLARKEEIYYRMCRFWGKVFAINFGVGVVSGVVMEFEFGTNWARFSAAGANVFAPLLYFEVLTAFFLEGGFLGIMLFGWKRVHRAIHFVATFLVAAGSILSAFWILAANSWMQTPAGFRIIDGELAPTTFWEVTFNPSTLIRFGHMTVASFETAVFAVAGISAFFLLKRRHVPFFCRSMAVALLCAALFAPLQVYLGDVSGKQVFAHQPTKLAAMESHWETNTDGGAPFAFIAIPDPDKERNRFEIAVPDFLSLLLTYTRTGRVQGLKEFPPQDRPNVPVVFTSFRLMVAIGFLFLFVMIWALLLFLKGRLFEQRAFLWTLAAMQPLGWIAVELGWITAEMGRQPWLVYGIMRTSEGVSPVPAGNVVWSLALFIVIFLAVGGSYLYYVLRAFRRGPDMDSPIPPVQRPAGTRIAEGKAEKGDMTL